MNTDIRISISFKGHRKRKKLRRAIGDKSDSYLLDLWLTVSTDCPSGVLSGWKEEDIADACGWDDDPKIIVDALVDSGWLDRDDENNYAVHDWETHQAWACNAEKRSEAARKAALKRWGNDGDGKKSLNGKDKDFIQGACGPHKDSSAPYLSFPYLSYPNLSLQTISVPLKDGSLFTPDEKFIKTLIDAYSNIDIVFEFKKIISWCESNPGKRKTKSGVKKFINSWLSRANDKKKPEERPKIFDFLKDE